MARYPVVNTATLVLTNPSAGPLLRAVETLQSAEDEFYRDRRNLVNSYPMKKKDITTSEIEKLYDTHLGNEPWRYKDRFDASGSALRTGDYDDTEHWVQPWGTTPSGSYPETREGAFLFDDKRGAAWVDLIVKYGYNNGFDRKGGEGSSSYEVRDGESTNYVSFPVYEGFGVEPVAYNGRGGLSGFEAHMLKLVGDAYEATVRSSIRGYRDSLESYQGSNGSPVGETFVPNNPSNPWEGFTGTAGGYNRPGELNAALVRETRGVD